MSATTELLDRYKDFHGLTSDYQAAKRLAVTQSAISKWRRGQSMDSATVLKIAQELEIEPLATLAQIHMDRPLTTRDRKIWSTYRARVSVAALAALTAGHLSTGPEAHNILPMMILSLSAQLDQGIDYAH